MKGIKCISDGKELQSWNKFKRSSNVQYEQLGKLDGEETQVIF